MLRALVAMAATATAWDHLTEIRDPETFAALLYVPEGALTHAEDQSWPLLLYLHGAGESGSDVRELISEGATGTPPVALERGAAIPELAEQFVVVAPQTSRGWDPSDVARFVDFLGRSPLVPKLDGRRLYVTGHSMGGAGATYAATTGRFAACVPVAPAGTAGARTLVGVPVWAFHGRNDVIVPSDYSTRLVKALRKLGVPEDDARETIYDTAPTPPGWPSSVGHASTIPTYSDPALYAWLLAKTRPP